MKKYILRRFLLSLIVLFGVILIIFVITRVVPSDPAAKWAGARATAEQVAAARIELGLDKSLPVQFVKYLGDLVHGDLGESMVFEGRGYGHGVGMCQWSCLQMAKEGMTYKQILTYFYPGTTIQLYENR